MNEEFQVFVDKFDSPACVLSVSREAVNHRRTIRIVTGNRPYLDTIEKKIPGFNDHPKKFIPNFEYTQYVPQDMNFEAACIQAAINKKRVSGNAHLDQFGLWFNMLFIPLQSDDEDFGYCTYLLEISETRSAESVSAISSDIATAVLETCLKLRSGGDFDETINRICIDIRDLCDSEHCCIFMMDTAKRKCSVLCEAFSDNTKLLPMGTYVDDTFYDIAESWEATIAGSNCLIIKNDEDMEIIRERNPVWVDSITGAGGKNIVLFPMRFKGDLLGYIWAINFSAEKADKIKETLELTTFVLASELYSNRLIDKLHILSSRDMLTGVMNRNEMNNYVMELIDGKHSESVGVLFADLNGLKTINDSEGHIAGDNLLKNAAAVLKSVFARRQIFRAGGDEFVVILTRITETELIQKAEQLRKAAAQYDRLVFAIGAAYAEEAVNVRVALHSADERMYADKKRYYEQHPEMKRGGTGKKNG
jgi:diguanylate cyclase (GGDEF)-like protein